MDSSEDSEFRPVDSFSIRLQELRIALPSIEQVSSQRELETIIQKIEPFQEDPQLLDPDLRNFISVLTDKFLQHLHDAVILSRIGTILYTFCKVRGEKVIVGLLNNEPRWIEPLLALFGEQSDMIWQQSYVLLLWLSHLMLSPFDLASISSYEPEIAKFEFELPGNTPSIAIQVLEIGLKCLRSASIEQKAAASLLVRLCIRQDMLNLGMLKMLSGWAISEFGKVAGETETRLGLGLLTFLSKLVASADQKDLGSFLAEIYELSQRVTDDEKFEAIESSAIAKKLVIKIRRDTVIHCLRQDVTNLDTDTVIQEVIGSLIELLADADTPVRLSASKAISLVTLKLDEPEMANEIVEAVITSFDEDLTNDSLWAANPAKWHGLTFTLAFFIKNGAVSVDQLPAILARLLAALNFEQRSTNGKSVGANVRDAANLGLWCTARRFTTEQLQSFDAWEFAPKHEYPPNNNIDGSEQVSENRINIIQHIAYSLLQSACFDPDGNVRRGSSAALQELIGRHPNIVEEGISLVQIVDFQSVGLHSRAVTAVADAVTKTHQMYIWPLNHVLTRWRGLAAADFNFRCDAAVGAGKVCFYPDQAAALTREAPSNSSAITVAGAIAAGLIHDIRKEIDQLQTRQYEEQQGYLLALSWILSSINCQIKIALPRTSDQGVAEIKDRPRRLEDSVVLEALPHIHRVIVTDNNPERPQAAKPGAFLDLPEFAFLLSDQFKIRSQRAHTVAAAALRLLGQLAEYLYITRNHRLHAVAGMKWGYEQHASLLAKCLSPRDEMVLEQIPEAVRLSTQVLEPTERKDLVRSWLIDLLPENKKPGISSHGRLLALGAAFNEIVPEAEEGSTHNLILTCLRDTYIVVHVELKVVILRSVKLILSRLDQPDGTQDLGVYNQQKKCQYLGIITIILLLGLHDYTINERGDVGSLVRLAALDALDAGWKHGLLLGHELDSFQDDRGYLTVWNLEAYTSDGDNDIPLIEHLKASVLRLSLEKLDKVREVAMRIRQHAYINDDLLTTNFARVVPPILSDQYEIDPDVENILTYGLPTKKRQPYSQDYSSPSYFKGILPYLIDTNIKQHVRERIVEGLCSVAGGLSGPTLINSREAVHEFLAEGNSNSLLGFAAMLKSVIDISTKTLNDQRLVPILEVTAWILDMGLLQQIQTDGSNWKWQNFLSSIQKSHYLSKNAVKLQVVLDVYRGLAEIVEIKKEVVKKVVSMLLNPIPVVRITAAETLISVFPLKEMEDVDWTRPAKEIKSKVEQWKASIAADV